MWRAQFRGQDLAVSGPSADLPNWMPANSGPEAGRTWSIAAALGWSRGIIRGTKSWILMGNLACAGGGRVTKTACREPMRRRGSYS
jgi:hypothetical protein